MGKYEYESSAPADIEYNINDAVRVIPLGYAMDENFTPVVVAGFAIIKIWPANSVQALRCGRNKGTRYCVVRTRNCQSPPLKRPRWYPTVQAAKVSILAWVSTGHNKRRAFMSVDKHWETVCPAVGESGEGV